MERSPLITMIFLMAGCLGHAEVSASESVGQSIENSQYKLAAFGGTLYGQGRGEWIGGLYFRDEAGRAHEVIDQNVHGIIRNPAGVFVFTGLAHLGINDGYIYRISVDTQNRLVPARLGRLPGAPSQIRQLQDGVTAFLVFAGVDDAGFHYRCMSLRGKTVAESNLCDPPSRRRI